MKYFYHNCFGIEIENKTFIFDIPDISFLPEKIEKEIIKYIKNKNLYVFFSHSHADHFRSNINSLIHFSENTTVFAPEDVMHLICSDKYFNKKSLHQDEFYNLKEFKLQTFKSNDEGLAFLFTFNDKKIYFGGDLACWKWPDLTDDEYKLYVDYFYYIINLISKEKIDIAFTNWDARLSNYSGGLDFFNKVKPDIFVPMHFFGDLTIMKSVNVPSKNLFDYTMVKSLRLS
ncbi:MAG: MBL fold metallo-hydrolase [Candidatus Muiribacteriota bacterium]